MEIPPNCRCENLLGQTFNYLTVIDYAGSKKVKKSTRHYWVCICSRDENTVKVSSHRLKSGNTKSCGCLQKEDASKRMTKHGLRQTRIYNIWCGIKARCYNENNERYCDYGGRGIKMCDEWLNDPVVFAHYMGEPINKNDSIDRIDNNGNYEPGNVRWATPKEQGNNTRSCNYYEYNGEILNVTQLEIKYGFNQGTIKCRLQRGWTIQEAIETPLNIKKKSICKHLSQQNLIEFVDILS